MIKRRSFLKRSPIKNRGKSPRRSGFLKRSSAPIPKSNPVAQAKRQKRYKKALSNAHARAQRKMLLLRCNGICEKCGLPFTEDDPMERSHITYARFGNELDTDVQGWHRSENRMERAMRRGQLRKSA